MPTRSISPGLFADTPASSSTGQTGWVTAHCDGGARGNPGPAGYGAVLTGPAGEPLAELSEFLGVRTNNYAEYSGMLAVLEYALAHGHRRLRVVSDSELMVKQIQGKYRVNSPDLKPLWQEAKNRIARLDAFEISHALRHKNKDADRLANQAMDRGMKRPQAPGQPAPPPLKATPYPTKSSAPPDPDARRVPASGAGIMLRGFTRDGVVHVLGGQTLPDGVFVKIIPE
ncbi:ribonuclease HI family protein [Edaphobacter modestus]|uniref:Putative phosphoglycerate mutase n=1 Tax=Edaphobacter modestus TaxID=388466 RepID=A0A4Q7YUL8_9BACT|nr:ribonuclease HI family protein [Edaphobacter modestus]RZU41467.1 putative phosphoglycerate mutase [Edaphobacter modestus]